MIGFIPKQKKRAEGSLQAVGGQIRKNIDKGQSDLKTGRIRSHDAINPFKGTRTVAKKAWEEGKDK